MPLRVSYTKKIFEFSFKARTSRGLMKDKTSWFIRLWHEDDPQVFGLGECGPLPGLSIDSRPDYEEILSSVVNNFNQANFQTADLPSILNLIPAGFPSLIFGFETAILDFKNGGFRKIFDNSFFAGEPIPINGLIWMGDLDFLMGQLNIKIGEGFSCVKLKVGGLNFESECDILEYMRKRYYRENITVRLDANGAFKVDDVLYKLEILARYNIHSIEQPIKPGLPEMEELCRKSPIPIALDEELIGKETFEEKEKLLSYIKPHYIILKPMLHGGMIGCREWIVIAEKLGIGWWITSSLESNIGLNAICQFTANYAVTLPQGLGTGKIYDNNFESPLEVKQGSIRYNSKYTWDPFLNEPDLSAPQIAEE
jgi:o-succinylbenzoate synthase